MREDQFIKLSQAGENVQIEYKTCYEQISDSLYETVCSFLNHSGGHILVGVKIYNHFSTILNVVPFPSSDSFTKIFPLWYSSTIRFTSDRPSPQPRSLVVNPG